MAATHGRLTGKPGVCLTTLGPGALNLSTGAAYAHLGAMPMIMITGQKAILTSPAGALPDRRHRRHHEAADQDDAPDRQRRHHPHHGARRLPRRAWRSGPGRCTWNCPRTSPARRSRTSPLCRRTRSSSRSRQPRGARPRRRDDPGRRAPAGHDRRGRAAGRARRAASSSFVRRTGIPFFTTQMGKGAVAGGTEPLHGHRGAVRARLRARGDRRGRPDRRHRPRHGREAALHHGRQAGRR